MSNKQIKKIRGVFERPSGSGVWWIQYFDADRRRRREKAGTRDNAIKLVEKRRTERLTAKKLPEKLRAPAITFQQIADAALEYSKDKKASYQNDKYRMGLLSEQFGKRSAEGILPEEFEDWLKDEGKEREWSEATKNRYTALLKLTYRLAEKNRKVKINPARLLRMSEEDNARVRYLNQYKPLPTKIEFLKECETEEDRLRAVIRTECPNHLPEFEVALNTGMRRSEMYRATWPNVDLGRNLLTVPHSKNGKTRHVTLNSTARAMLEFQREKTRKSGSEHVFLSIRKDTPLTGNRHWFEDAVKKAGLKDFTWHCLRHTFASRLVMAGVDLRTVQELMGHKVIAMTCRYAHLAPDHKLAAVERIAAALPEKAQSATTTATSDQTASESSTMETEQTLRLQ